MLPIKINWVINLILALIFTYMLKETSNNNNKNSYSETTNITKEDTICKDGFCKLPNHKEISKQNKNDMNLFEPI